MRNLLVPIAAAAAMALTATGVQAATYVNYGPVGADGGFTITFGNTGITGSNFTDVFDFTMPSGWGDFVVTSTMSAGSQNIAWTDVTFNGESFGSGTVGQNQFYFLNGVELTLGADQQLVLSGVSGGNASYSGVISFIPTAAIPEPGAWALMIVGFGAAGALLRRSRGRTAFA